MDAVFLGDLVAFILGELVVVGEHGFGVGGNVSIAGEHGFVALGGRRLEFVVCVVVALFVFNVVLRVACFLVFFDRVRVVVLCEVLFRLFVLYLKLVRFFVTAIGSFVQLVRGCGHSSGALRLGHPVVLGATEHGFGKTGHGRLELRERVDGEETGVLDPFADGFGGLERFAVAVELRFARADELTCGDILLGGHAGLSCRAGDAGQACRAGVPAVRGREDEAETTRGVPAECVLLCDEGAQPMASQPSYVDFCPGSPPELCSVLFVSFVFLPPVYEMQNPALRRTMKLSAQSRRTASCRDRKQESRSSPRLG